MFVQARVWRIKWLKIQLDYVQNAVVVNMIGIITLLEPVTRYLLTNAASAAMKGNTTDHK